MKLYNTLTHKVEAIQPQHPPAITVYTCGPTVYDYPHIGNWFTFIRYDMLIRTLKLAGLQPKWVMNITDVGHLVSDADEGEDKLEKGARREGKTAWDVANFYTNYFVDGIKRLNIVLPDYLPRATEHIPEQIALIKALEDKGYTYRIDDGIYYDTSRFPHYADFARLDLDELQAGGRVEHNPQKHNPSDFALWKFSPRAHKRDMEWDSPWGTGFPGWHVECSAMAMEYLGETLDVHSGGIDHIPVHHTNEIAQSQAATGKPFALYWMHTNHITVEGEKISKSLGNGITLEDIEAKGFSLEAFRLLVLESHYRSQSKFSWESLDAAQNRLQSYQAMSDMQWQRLAGRQGADSPMHFQGLLAQMEDDLNTPEALARLSSIAQGITDNGIPDANKVAFRNFLHQLDGLFGLGLAVRQDISPVQKQLITKRELARKGKDWQKSDELRAQLQKQGIGLRDTPRSVIWYRT